MNLEETPCLMSHRDVVETEGHKYGDILERETHDLPGH